MINLKNVEDFFRHQFKEESDNCLICGRFIKDGEGHYKCPGEGIVCRGDCKNEYDRKKIRKLNYAKND